MYVHLSRMSQVPNICLCVFFYLQDLAGNVAGGMWLSALLLCGVNPNIVNSYKTLMGVITNVTEDFALYFFGFVVTHLIHEFTV